MYMTRNARKRSNIDGASESARLELEIFDRAMAPARLDSSNKDFLFESIESNFEHARSKSQVCFRV